MFVLVAIATCCLTEMERRCHLRPQQRSSPCPTGDVKALQVYGGCRVEAGNYTGQVWEFSGHGAESRIWGKSRPERLFAPYRSLEIFQAWGRPGIGTWRSQITETIDSRHSCVQKPQNSEYLLSLPRKQFVNTSWIGLRYSFPHGTKRYSSTTLHNLSLCHFKIIQSPREKAEERVGVETRKSRT